MVQQLSAQQVCDCRGYGSLAGVGQQCICNCNRSIKSGSPRGSARLLAQGAVQDDPSFMVHRQPFMALAIHPAQPPCPTAWPSSCPGSARARLQRWCVPCMRAWWPRQQRLATRPCPLCRRGLGGGGVGWEMASMAVRVVVGEDWGGQGGDGMGWNSRRCAII